MSSFKTQQGTLVSISTDMHKQKVMFLSWRTFIYYHNLTAPLITVSFHNCGSNSFVIINIIIMNFNRRNSHGHHGSKHKDVFHCNVRHLPLFPLDAVRSNVSISYII